MGDLRHQILLARGSTSNVNNKKSNLSYGEPLFDREMNYLYIGQKNSGANNPITSDRVWGKINNIEYSFNADTTGAYIKSNTLQFDVKDTSSNNILSATNSNLIFKGDLKSGDKTIYTSNTDTLTANKISSRSGGTLSIDATSSVSFNGNITATDKTITAKTFIGEYETGDDTLSINKWSNTAQGKTILRVKGNSFLYYESLLGVIAKPQTIVNSDIGVETLTSSSKNYIVGFGLDTKDKSINAGTGSVTAAKFIGNLDGTSTYADYASSDKSKGTIEERLTNLGFNEGSISFVDGITATTNKLTRQGNYVLGSFYIKVNLLKLFNISDWDGRFISGKYIGDVPENFRPAGTDTKMFALWVTNPWPFKLSDNTSSSGSIGITCSLKINSYGVLTCDVKGEYSGSGKLLLGAQIDSADSANIRLQCNFGYEALPLK